jgi:ABC-type oligopeptide transport system substrate-binding subunit
MVEPGFRVLTWDLPGHGSSQPGDAEVSEQPFSVTYRIREDATWNDGIPVTARDFAFTWETLTNPEWNIVVR